MRPTHDESLVGRVAATGLLTLAVVVGGWMLAACSAEAENTATTGSDDVVAVVDGKTITKTEVEESAADQLAQTEAQLAQCELNYKKGRHEVIEQATRQVVQERLVEAEAAARGVSTDELLEQIAPAEVTDADVDAFYEENKARIGDRTKEQVAPQIRQYLVQQRAAEAQDNFYSSLEQKYEVDYKIEPYRVEVAADGKPAKGPADAPVTIVEFSDFECPYCSRVNPTLEQVQETYGDKVRIVFRQFPLAMHANAQKAAEASLCAHDQGKFWELHDLMFEEQRKLTVADLKEKAERIGLDTETFDECLDSDKYAQTVRDDMAAGQAVGVSGTPAMFINGRLVAGAVPFEQIAEVIDEELERAGAS